MRRIILGCLLCAAAMPGTAQTVPNPIDMLKQVTDAVCVPIPLEGGTITKAATAKAEAGLTKVLKSFADVGLELKGSYVSEQYVNVAHGELSGQINAQRDCNMMVYRDFNPAIMEFVAKRSAGDASTITVTNTGSGNANVAGDGNTTNVTINQ